MSQRVPQQTSSRNGHPTEVILVTGKKKNKAFRTALQLHRENASLQESQIVEKTHDEKENPQHDVPKEEGHDAWSDQYDNKRLVWYSRTE